MALLRDTTRAERQALLELFPLSALRSNWPDIAGYKEERCSAIAEQNDEEAIASFVFNNFSRCKYHTHILEPTVDRAADLTTALPDPDLLLRRGDTSLYLAELVYSVLLSEPFEEVNFRMVWPIRITRRDGLLVISIIVLERDVRPMFDRPTINVRRHTEESGIVAAIQSLGSRPVDINKGIKALWEADFYDAFKSKFKKPRSIATESMDRARGIKTTAPRLYRQMLGWPLYETMFRVKPAAESPVEVFQAIPTDGVIRMVRYTEGHGNSDDIVEAVLRANR